jgi:hypothetical protein
MTGIRANGFHGRAEERLIDSFVADAAALPVVCEIWIQSGEAIDVTIVVSEHDALSELQLSSLFHTLSLPRTRPRCGELALTTNHYGSTSAVRRFAR